MSAAAQISLREITSDQDDSSLIEYVTVVPLENVEWSITSVYCPGSRIQKDSSGDRPKPPEISLDKSQVSVGVNVHCL